MVVVATKIEAKKIDKSIITILGIEKLQKQLYSISVLGKYCVKYSMVDIDF